MSSERRWRTVMTAQVALLVGAACADFSRGAAVGSSGSSGSSSGAADASASGAASSSSYGADIAPLLLDGCAACHSPTGAASSTGFVLSGDVLDDYQSTLGFVDVDAPDQSRLIAKMEGRGHAGGAVYTRASPERAQVLRWIGEGAAP